MKQMRRQSSKIDLILDFSPSRKPKAPEIAKVIFKFVLGMPAVQDVLDKKMKKPLRYMTKKSSYLVHNSLYFTVLIGVTYHTQKYEASQKAKPTNIRINF